MSEKEPNRLVLLWHPELVEVTAVLKDLHLVEEATHVLNELEAILLHVEELHEMVELDFVVLVELSLQD